MLHRKVALCLALATAALPATAEAGGFTITLFGARRLGMGANTARPDDLTALYHNPAQLADQPGYRFHASGSATFLGTKFSLKALDPARFPEINPEGCGQGKAAPCPWPINDEGYYAQDITPESTFGVLPYLGASTDLGFVGRKDIVVAGALYAPNFYGGFFSDRAPSAYHFIEGLFLVGAASAGVGWRINRYISVGMSLSYLYMRLNFAQKYSMVDVLTPEGQAPDGVADAAQILLGDLRLDYTGQDHGMSWIASVLVDPFPWLAIGLTYTGSTTAYFEGDVELKTVAEQSIELSTAFRSFGYAMPRSLVVEMVIPHSVAYGINISPTPWLEIAADNRIYLYTLYDKQRISPRYDPADAALTKPMTEESLTKDKHYNLSWSTSLGVLVRPWRRYPGLELMAGWFFDKSPIPDETFAIDNPSLDQTGLTTGVRVKLDRWTLAATYMLDFHLERVVTTSQTSPPTNARGRGIAHTPALIVEYHGG